MADPSSFEARSYCRTCQACCGTVVTVEDGRLVKVRGDRADPMSLGYACFKGLQAPEYHNDAARLLHPLQRIDGRLQKVSSAAALAAAGDRLAGIVARHGGSAVGLYMGTQSLFNTPMQPLMRAFTSALGSARLFATMTIDQSAKWIAEARLGVWNAGPQTFEDANVWMMVGSNPAVSMVMGAGANHIAFPNPIKTLRAAKARGLKLIVIDPRRSETAVFADVFLQPRPGTDALIAASMLHVVLHEGWQDEDFCRAHVDGVEQMRLGLAGFAPERTAAATGLDPQDLRRAVRLFAKESQSGMVGTGTGTDMGPHSNVAEHLFQALNVVCGRFPRAGESVGNAGVLTPATQRHAEVRRVPREWESGARTLTHGLGPIHGTMMSTAIADEILSNDPKRMRALICVGGNPALALPDAERTLAALGALELLIVIDPRLTATARRADVVFAPTLQYERPDHTGMLERLFQRPYAHATPVIVSPPLGADVIDDAQALLSLAGRLGLRLVLNGQSIRPAAPVSADALLALVANESAVPLLTIDALEGGSIVEVAVQTVRAGRSEARFQVLPSDVATELAALNARAQPTTGGNTLKLIVRRHREVMNSTGTDLAATATRFPANTAFCHRTDLIERGLKDGDLVRLARDGRSISARVATDATVRPGSVSIAHCWPSADGGHDATNLLVDADAGAQSINRMPLMTGIEVTLEPAAAPA